MKCQQLTVSIQVKKIKDAIEFSIKDTGIGISKNILEHIFDEIKHFFSVYKDLEGKKTAVNEFDNALGAVEVIEECIDRYKQKFGDGQAREQ